MPNWSTLLVATDFSASATDALRVACELARERSARVVLEHATALPDGLRERDVVEPAGAPVTAGEYARQSARARLEAAAAPWRAAGVAIELRVDLGPPEESILAAAREVGADLIVMGTHGRTGLAHLVLGSVAERVLRRASVPVLTVRQRVAEAGETATDAEVALRGETAG